MNEDELFELLMGMSTDELATVTARMFAGSTTKQDRSFYGKITSDLSGKTPAQILGVSNEVLNSNTVSGK